MAIVKPTHLPQKYQTKLAYDDDGNLIYIGMSLESVLVSEAAWQIRKLTYDDNGNLTSVFFANGSHAFDYVWDSRAGYTYS